MQRDEHFEKKLQQLKKAYEQKPTTSDPEQILSKLDLELEREASMKKRRRFVLPAVITVTAVLIVFIVVTPEFIPSPQEARQLDESLEMNHMHEHNVDTFTEGRTSSISQESEKVETITIEGTTEQMLFLLAEDESVQISTYYPEDMFKEEIEEGLLFTANVNGVKEENAYVEIRAIDPLDENVVAQLYGDYVIMEKREEEFTISFSEREYAIKKGVLKGTASLFERNDTLFLITVHYPEEYEEAMAVRANKIISELQFHN